MSENIRVVIDPDIGRCDDCLSDEGRRVRRFRDVKIQGEPVRIAVWLCPECRAADHTERNDER